MKLFLTYCSWQKDDSIKNKPVLVGPDQLYTSERLQIFVKACTAANADWAIFSDKYGIWFPNEKKAWYDKSPDSVTPQELSRIVSNSVKSLEKYQVYFFGDSNDPKFHPLYKEYIHRLEANGITVTVFDDLDIISELNTISGQEYSPETGVLFLGICSFNKAKEGFPYFDDRSTIFNKLSGGRRQEILTKRHEAFQLLISGKLFFDNSNLKDHEYNAGMSDGPDFGGSGAGYYLPAIWRYEGRFFNNLKISGKKAVLQSKHHFLIISGLYGALTPVDPIQLYSVPLYDGDPVQKIWREDNYLTKVLFEYVTRHNIKRLFDFTGIYYYRDLINWPEFKGMVAGAGIECDVLHAFSSRGAGDNALPAFGECISENLIHYDEGQLLSIAPEESIGPVYFRAVYGAHESRPSDFPSTEMMLNLDKIVNTEARKILRSAENAAVYSYRNPNNPPDAGSSLIWQYGKGLEKLLHCEITCRIGYQLRERYHNHIPDSVRFRPKEEDRFWKAFWESGQAKGKQITLGSWSRLDTIMNQYRNNPFSTELTALLNREFSGKFIEIFRRCGEIEGVRNAATHPKIISFEEGMGERRKIVPNINAIIDLIYH